jgi:hypothetical protein
VSCPRDTLRVVVCSDDSICAVFCNPKGGAHQPEPSVVTSALRDERRRKRDSRQRQEQLQKEKEGDLKVGTQNDSTHASVLPLSMPRSFNISGLRKEWGL